MKPFIFGLLMSSIFLTQNAYANCSNKPGPDGTVPKCLPPGVLQQAGTSTAGVGNSWLDDVFTAEGYSLDYLLSNCKKASEDFKVTSLGKEANCTYPKEVNFFRACRFVAVFDCNVNGSNVRTRRKGSCVGQMHDCGTLKYCADDETKFSCTEDAWKKAKPDSFHTADAVPKTLDLNSDAIRGEGKR